MAHVVVGAGSDLGQPFRPRHCTKSELFHPLSRELVGISQSYRWFSSSHAICPDNPRRVVPMSRHTNAHMDSSIFLQFFSVSMGEWVFFVVFFLTGYQDVLAYTEVCVWWWWWCVCVWGGGGEDLHIGSPSRPPPSDAKYRICPNSKIATQF